MARSPESLWLAASGACTTVAVTLLGAGITLNVTRTSYPLWSAGPMIGAYAAGVLALFCFGCAAREVPFPLGGERPQRRHQVAAPAERQPRAREPAALAPPGPRVVLKPRQDDLDLLLLVTNGGDDRDFTAEVNGILDSYGRRDGHPQRWPLPWEGLAPGPLVQATKIRKGETKTLRLARFNAKAVEAYISSGGRPDGPHWIFLSGVTQYTRMYAPFRLDDVSRQRFVVIVRIGQDEKWSRFTEWRFAVGARRWFRRWHLICEPTDTAPVLESHRPSWPLPKIPPIPPS